MILCTDLVTVATKTGQGTIATEVLVGILTGSVAGLTGTLVLREGDIRPFTVVAIGSQFACRVDSMHTLHK